MALPANKQSVAEVNLAYDLQRDLTPISLLEAAPWAIAVGQHLPAMNVKEFIALARSKPGKLSNSQLRHGAKSATTDLRGKLAATGSVTTSSTPDELRKRYEDWSRIFGKIAMVAGLKLQSSLSTNRATSSWYS